jgi:hypothetical protein
LFLGNFLVFGIAYYSFIFLKQKKELCPPCVCGIPDGLCCPLVILEQQKEKKKNKTNPKQHSEREKDKRESGYSSTWRERGQKRKETRAGASPVPTPDSYLYTSAPF